MTDDEKVWMEHVAQGSSISTAGTRALNPKSHDDSIWLLVRAPDHDGVHSTVIEQRARQRMVG